MLHNGVYCSIMVYMCICLYNVMYNIYIYIIYIYIYILVLYNITVYNVL